MSAQPVDHTLVPEPNGATDFASLVAKQMRLLEEAAQVESKDGVTAETGLARFNTLLEQVREALLEGTEELTADDDLAQEAANRIISDEKIANKDRYKGQNLSVLIADDDDDVADTLVAHLEWLGVENITVVESIDEETLFLHSFAMTESDLFEQADTFVKKYRRENRPAVNPRPSIVFQDNDFGPEHLGEGVAFLRKLPENFPGYNPVKIMYSGNHSLAEDYRINEFGAGFVTKPFTEGDLVKVMDKAVEKLKSQVVNGKAL